MIFVVDQRRGTLIALDSLNAGAPFKHIVPNSVSLGPMKRPSGIVQDADGMLVVADSGNDRVLAYHPATDAWVALDSNASTVGPLRQPTGVAVTATGQLIVADTGNRRVVFAAGLTPAPDSDGETWEGTVSVGYEAPTGVCVDWAGRILVADPGTDRLVRLDALSSPGWTEIALPPGARTPRPYALASGPDGGVLVADLVNARILLLAADDSVSVLIDGAGDRSLIAPVATSMLDGDIIIADAVAACITRWALDPASDSWQVVERLDGRGGLGGGPALSSLSGLTTGELV